MTAVVGAAIWLAVATPANAQVGALVSPGPLSKAHSQLEGIANCQKCHEPGRALASAKCLGCHKPVAERMAGRRGVHRDVAGKCEGCHAEHRGVATDLRPLDVQRFNHATETGYALDGRHGPLSRDCARCHKTRSFLNAPTACAACHQDPHKGALGTTCSTCHSTAAPFAEARRQFDHAKARFALTGAHRTVDCAKCHVNKVYRGLTFGSCAACHREPHRQAFGPDCTKCHTTDTWKTRSFDHARTAFPLKGAHATAVCTACHVRPATQVHLQAKACRDCHNDVHAGQFKQDCGSCHTQVTFKKAPFEHDTATRFPLTGRHTALACSRCHKGAATAGPARTTGTGVTIAVKFSGLSAACASCHEDVHRGAAGQTCDSCHTTTDFRGLKPYTHSAPLSGFLSGPHAAAPCRECHGREPGAPIPPAGAKVASWTFKGLGTGCARCHTDPHNQALGNTCERCHAVDEVGFAAAKFSHGTTAFQLTGKHVALRCSQCHEPRGASPGQPPARPRPSPARDASGRVLSFKAKGTACAACHKDVHLGQLGQQCQGCHSPEAFSLKTYTHKQLQAGFFVGAHSAAACGVCHKSETGAFPSGKGTAVRFAGLGSTCASCHGAKDTHRGALGTQCEQCHTPVAWRSASRAFHKATLFPLEGRHLAAPCAGCHVAGVTKGTPTKCFDCHWIRRRDDPYETRLGNQCEMCHRPTSWTAVNWNHGPRTGFALNVAHRVLDCGSCHKDGRFTGAGFSCVSCHLQSYQQTSRPNHVAAGFPTTCEACHKPSHTSWTQAAFSHTVFPLAGLHASQTCATCHKNGVYPGTPRECVGCHLTDYQKTTSPNHAAAGFATACDTCHRSSDTSWMAGTGSGSHPTSFTLMGLHATQACASCHKNGVYKGTPRDCVGCHLTDYQKTTSPNHAASGIATTCDACHRATDTGWAGGGFNHASTFPLLGLHATLACASCHKNGVYKGTPRDCVGCHLADYQKTTNPNHAASGFATTCETCHRATDTSWKGGGFSHSNTFPLVGLHATQACATCHKNGVYAGTPRDCVGCHLADYQRTTNPNHGAAGFPTTCDGCHNPSATSFAGAVFNHSSVFALVGLHATQACATCHKSGVYRGTPRDCAGCHLANYQGTTNPNHSAAGFPTTCDTCHRATDTTWNQGQFAHTAFPITSGRHVGLTCATCHTTPNVFAAFSCVAACHARATTDSHHSGRSGYRYDSAACYSCHPNGRAGTPRPQH